MEDVPTRHAVRPSCSWIRYCASKHGIDPLFMRLRLNGRRPKTRSNPSWATSTTTRAPKSNRLRTRRPGPPEVWFRVLHVAPVGHNGAPVAEFHEQIVEIALGPKGAFENGSVPSRGASLRTGS